MEIIKELWEKYSVVIIPILISFAGATGMYVMKSLVGSKIAEAITGAKKKAEEQVNEIIKVAETIKTLSLTTLEVQIEDYKTRLENPALSDELKKVFNETLAMLEKTKEEAVKVSAVLDSVKNVVNEVKEINIPQVAEKTITFVKKA